MAVIKNPSRKFLAATLLFVLSSFAGCGLGMTDEERVLRGEQSLADGNFQAAIIDAKRVLQGQPENIEARVLLGRALIASGDAAQAERELRRALEAGLAHDAIAVDLSQTLLMQQRYEQVLTVAVPETIKDTDNRLRIQLIRGEALLGLERAEEARAIFSQVLSEVPDQAQAMLGLARSYAVDDMLVQARHILDEALTVDPNYVVSWISSGALALQMNDRLRSEEDFRRAAEIARGARSEFLEISALHHLAEVLLLDKRTDEMRPVLARLEHLAFDDPRTLMSAAKLAIADNDWHEAQRLLQELLQILPEHRQARYLLGIAHMRSGDLGQAEMYLTAAVAADPGDENARRLLAKVRLDLDKADEARNAIAPLLGDLTANGQVLAVAAVASLRSGEFGDAIELLERGLQEDPDNTGLKLQLAFVSAKVGNLERAHRILASLPVGETQSFNFERHWLETLLSVAGDKTTESATLAEALVARWPERASAHIVLGIAYAASGQPEKARQSLDLAEELAPEDDMPVLILAQLDETEGRFDAAEKRYMELHQRDPSAVHPMISLARLAARRKNAEKQIYWLEEARAADDLAVAPRRLLANAYLASGDIARAGKLAVECLDRDDELAEMHVIAGMADLQHGDYHGAESRFRKASLLEPGKQSYRRHLSNAQALRGDRNAAIATLEEEYSQTLEDMASAALLAVLKFDVGETNEAMAIPERLRKVYPDSGAPFAIEAELLVRQGKLRAAAAAYDRAQAVENVAQIAARSFQLRRDAGLPDQIEPLHRYLDERPLDQTMRSYLAQAYLDSGEWEAAAKELMLVLESDPDNYVAANNLAWAYLEMGDRRAETFARRAYDLQPANASVLDTLGWILVNTGKADEGIVLLRDAVNLANDNAEIRYHLAAGLAASRETQEAKAILRELLDGSGQFTSRNEAEELMSDL